MLYVVQSNNVHTQNDCFGLCFSLVESKCLPINPCQNGGTCTEAHGTYQCDCSPGWSGLSCEGKIAVVLAASAAAVVVFFGSSLQL